MYTSAEIEIEFTGFTLKAEHLLTIEITQQFNDHARLKFTRLVKEENFSQYQEILKSLPALKVNCRGEKSGSQCIFQGLLTHIELNYDRVEHHYLIAVEGISYTYALDASTRDRSFPDAFMQYRDLIGSIIDSGNFLYNEDPQTTGHFLLQYKETDWGFFKRLASHFNSGLIADATADKPRFSFGVPRVNSKQHALNFLEMDKGIEDYRKAQASKNSKIREADFTEYYWKTGEIFQVGEELEDSEHKQNLRVKAVEGKLDGSHLQFTYTLARENGLTQNFMLNPAIAGVSLEGTVTGTEKDRVKASLALDGPKTSKVCQFPLGTFYGAASNTGWYCMPETGDTVAVYFPSLREEEAIVLTSYRKKEKGSDRTQDPGHKYLRTKNLKEVHFAPEAINLTVNENKNKEVYVYLNQTDGVTVNGNKKVTLQGVKDISLESKTSLYLSAKQSVTFKAKNSQSQIVVNQSGVAVKGKKVNKAEQKEAESQESQNSTSTSTTANNKNDNKCTNCNREMGFLSSHYESTNNPGDTSNGKGDAGGVSYGAFQFASAYNIPYDFVQWIKSKNENLYKRLNSAYIKDGHKYGRNFNTEWSAIGKERFSLFLNLQREYTKTKYYDIVVRKIKQLTGFDIDNCTCFILKNVIWSRAVQHGIKVAPAMIARVLRNFDKTTVTNAEIINAIYEESGKVIERVKGRMDESNFAKNSKGVYLFNESSRRSAIIRAKNYGIYGKSMKYYYTCSVEVQVSVWERLNVNEKNDALKSLCNICKKFE